MKMKQIYALAILTMCILPLLAQGNGVISGKIVDGKSGETLIGATVVVDNNTELATSTDIDGNFTIAKVPDGPHEVMVRYIGYKEKKELNVVVKSGEVTNLYWSLNEDAVTLGETVIVAESTKKDNESAIYLMQKNSTVIQSGISQEDIKRSPDRNSGEAIRRVSGSTIQDGKFAIIRGLADRYNMAMLNNVILPSTEPDRKAFAFDVFPSNVLDNIVIIKTGQPDLPSEWSGGLIQLNTRDIPEKSFFSASISQTFIEQTTFKKYESYDGSKTDWLGFDKSSRPLPGDFPNSIDLNNIKLDKNSGDTTAANKLLSLGKQLYKKSWSTNKNKIAYPGQSIQLSGGFAVRKNENQFGGVFGLSYSNTIRYTTGEQVRYDGTLGEKNIEFNNTRYNKSVSAALLANLSTIIKKNHKITWKNLYTVNSDNNTVELTGVSYFSGQEFKRTNLEFISSRVFSTNLIGEHLFGQGFKWRWNGGVVLINRDQPKSIRYTYQRVYESDAVGLPNETTDPYQFIIQQDGSNPYQSTMFYSKLKETGYSASTDLLIPIKGKAEKHNIRVGYWFNYRKRAFEARNLFFDVYGGSITDSIFYKPVDEIINQENFDNKLLILNQLAQPQDQYTATATTHAAYIMAENNFTSWFKAVYGFRFEYYKQGVTAPNNLEIQSDLIQDPGEDGILNTADDIFSVKNTSRYTDSTYSQSYFSGAYYESSPSNTKPIFPLLPSVNLIFKVAESMNVRASYSQSMSRPELREVSPFVYYDFARDLFLVGNVNLRQTFAHNADLRFEYFMGRGQAVNVSVFYKNFTNTIEQTLLATGGTQQFIYSNADKAFLVGAELEVRKNFGFITPALEPLVFTANLAYIYSRVDLRNVKNNSSDEQLRPMQGQSPYIVNLGLSYVHPKYKFGASLLYNQVGDRLYSIGEVGNPSWYEHFRPLLDLQLSQKLWKDRIMLRLTFSDLIARPTIFYQNDKIGNTRGYNKKKDQIVLKDQNFRSYTFQISFNF
jgi:outer membrane receptor protein involved in Fe transport